MHPSPTGLFGRLSLFVLLASGLGCASEPHGAAPASFSFHPTRAGAALWLSTPIAVEITSETDARDVEALDPLYVGELALRGGRLRPSQVALLAAEAGATHFRVLAAGDDARLDVILYRLESARWPALPRMLRPAPVTGPRTATRNGARGSL